MKSLIFISAALMAGAAIFGFVDYKKKEQSKEFNALYKEEKPVVQLAPEIVSSPAPIIAVNATSEETVEKAKSTVRKKGKHKKIGYVLYSRASPRELPEEEVVEPAPPVKELQ